MFTINLEDGGEAPSKASIQYLNILQESKENVKFGKNSTFCEIQLKTCRATFEKSTEP